MEARFHHRCSGRQVLRSPLGKVELVAPKASFRPCNAPNDNAHLRSLPNDAVLLRARLSRCDDTARDQSRPSLVLAHENEDGVNLSAKVHHKHHGPTQAGIPGVGNSGAGTNSSPASCAFADRLSSFLLIRIFVFRMPAARRKRPSIFGQVGLQKRTFYPRRHNYSFADKLSAFGFCLKEPEEG